MLKVVVHCYTCRKGKTRDLNLFKHAAFDIVFLCMTFYFSLLGMFTKLQKATLASSFLSVHTEKLSSHWMNFQEICYLSIFRKSVAKIQVSLKSVKNKITLLENQCTFMIISHSVLHRMSRVSDKSCRENQNTHFVFNNFF
jgi:hypothetical protein